MTTDAQAPPATEEEGDLQWVRDSIGHMTYDQEQAIRTALADNAPGVHALAAEIASDPSVRSPIAVLLYGLKEGKHNAKPRTSPRAKKQRITPPLDRAHKLFTGKLRDLDATPWLEPERIEFAIDYALDHCGAYGQALMDTETQLRLELHAPRWHPTDLEPDVPPDPAKYTEHQAAMREAHRSEPEPEEPLDDDDIPY